MPFKVISGSTKVVDFGTNRKRVYDFLLVINSNLCRISHRFGDTATYWSKIANSYPPHPHSTPWCGVTLTETKTKIREVFVDISSLLFVTYREDARAYCSTDSCAYVLLRRTRYLVAILTPVIRPPVYGSNGRSYKMLVMFLFFQRVISEFPRPITAKLRHMIGTCVYFIN